jgi:hypothetical protein
MAHAAVVRLGGDGLRVRVPIATDCVCRDARIGHVEQRRLWVLGVWLRFVACGGLAVAVTNVSVGVGAGGGTSWWWGGSMT